MTIEYILFGPDVSPPDECCGFAGTSFVGHSEISKALPEKKIESIMESSARSAPTVPFPLIVIGVPL
jgi:Fe-S oxidoreductase